MLGNWFKTTLLMAAIVALFGVVGAALGGMNGMVIALLIAAAMNFTLIGFLLRQFCVCTMPRKSVLIIGSLQISTLW